MLSAANERGFGPVRRGSIVTNNAEYWRLDVVAQTDRLVGVAMKQLDDANEARWLVHRIMLRSMDHMPGPISGRELDTALGDALNRVAANAN